MFKLPTIEYHRYRRDMIEVHKMTTEIYDYGVAINIATTQEQEYII